MDQGLTRGFSLIQMIIVILILAIIASVSVPRLSLFTPSPCDEFAQQCTHLLRLAYVRALATSNMHRIFFRSADRTMILQHETGTRSTGELIFEPVGTLSVPTQYTWSGAVKIRNFFIKKIDENAGGTLKDAWFYIFPAGLTQEIIINVENTTKPRDLRGLVINPFSSQCAVYDTFQKP